MAESIPPPSGTIGTTVISFVALSVGLLVIYSYVPFGSLVGVSSTLILFVLVATFLVRRLSGRGYTFDEVGVERSGKLLFRWAEVDRISLKFSKDAHSLTLVAQPTWAAFLSGPLIQKDAWVDYGIGVVFALKDRSSVFIKSNLDSMTKRGTIERMDEAAKSANSSIKFD